MKTTGHPEYKEVIFLDTSCNFSFLTRSCADTKGREKMKWTDGKEYPLVKIEISSESHPFMPSSALLRVLCVLCGEVALVVSSGYDRLSASRNSGFDFVFWTFSFRSSIASAGFMSFSTLRRIHTR